MGLLNRLNFATPPEPGVTPNWPETGNQHSWYYRGMAIWWCSKCLTQVQTLPSGLLKSCNNCRRPWGGVHEGPRGWRHVSNGAVSEFVRTKAEASQRYSELAKSGDMSLPTPPPPLQGCHPRTTCSAVILGTWNDYECGRPVAGVGKNGLLLCVYHLSHPYAESIEKMQDWTEPDRSSCPIPLLGE